ncbi:HI0074 family nucleotidyltransferase substrate-binding subunit [Lentibacillus sediminis]|uniref:HI0074 family nucleotidyltransferase substrate-binding subunit n=1 Tax=Lentibacillus sediminis TaxID=1940529 RepID=UPI000C1C36B7|nr:HI0074 family nucleotidyltransferase substrate-binding subunit [Lentibacillus sediminis]
MKRLQERLQGTEQALDRLQEVIEISIPSMVERDAGIQRFKVSFQAAWKTAKEYLYRVEGLDVVSPKGVLRSSRELGILSEDETALGLQMTDDRNLTVYAYEEQLAEEIFYKIPQYYQLMREWMRRISGRVC